MKRHLSLEYICRYKSSLEHYYNQFGSLDLATLPVSHSKEASPLLNPDLRRRSECRNVDAMRKRCTRRLGPLSSFNFFVMTPTWSGGATRRDQIGHLLHGKVANTTPDLARLFYFYTDLDFTSRDGDGAQIKTSSFHTLLRRLSVFLRILLYFMRYL